VAEGGVEAGSKEGVASDSNPAQEDEVCPLAVAAFDKPVSCDLQPGCFTETHSDSMALVCRALKVG